ncbi:MAG: NfeD family protein [Planctomycetota bacterium]|nr:NfeD family protein [Planctomycetota bacterium]
MITLLAQAATTAGDAPLMWGVILAAAALFLLFLELFVPSGGILSLCSGVAVLGSVVAFFTYDTTTGLVALAAYIFLGPIVLWAGFKWWGASPHGPRMILGANDHPIDRSQAEGFAASQARMRDRAHRLDVLIGRRGTTETRLSPVGSIRIDGERYEALAENGMLDAEVEIEVTEAYDNQLKVRAIEA